VRLSAHPAHPARGITLVDATIGALGVRWLTLRWRIEGAGKLVAPAFAGKGRADDLWRTTCFELFVGREGEGGYAEFNLSPSERWAAYDFTAYREGMAERPVPRDPVCAWRHHGDHAIFDAAIPVPALPSLPWHFGLTAVLEEEGGVKSYWAAAHSGGQPDFHDRATFASQLFEPDHRL
jgi:hypothetical protein